MNIDLQLIADALNMTRSAIDKRAKRERWVFEERAVRGGRSKVFTLENLPIAVVRAIERHTAITSRAEEAAETLRLMASVEANKKAHRALVERKSEANLEKLMAPLPAGVQSRFDGRYAVVKGWERWFPTVQPIGRNASFAVYADAFNAGAVDIGAAVLERFKPLSARSIQRWVLTFEKQGMACLIDSKNGKARKDVTVFTRNPQMEMTTIAILIARPTITIKNMHDMLKQASVDKETGEVLFDPPTYSATLRFCNAWKSKNAELHIAATNPDQWKNTHMVGFGSISEDVVRLNQRWAMDATPADWMLQDENGLRRYTASGVIDIYSRRAIYIFAPTPRAITHKLLLRLAILQWGIPEQIVTDNGADYVGKEFVATLQALEIEHTKTDPFSPWQKGHIERMNETLLHSVLEVHSSFIGHNVAERSAIEARDSFAERLYQKDAKLIELAMPAHLLQTRVNEWMKGVYEQRPHHGDHMDGVTPFAKAAGYRGEVRRVTDERALDVLLAQPAGKGTYVVSKKGLVILGAQFIAAELALLVGKMVHVYNTEDYGQLVVYHEGKFICVAHCPERSGVSRQAIAVHARNLQAQHIKQQKAQIRRTKVDPDALLSDFLRSKAEQAGKLAVIPQPSRPHHTAALTASGHAARALDGHAAATSVPRELQTLMDRRHAEDAAPAAEKKVAVIPETPQLRFRKWLELDELLTQGKGIDDVKLTRWYGSYPQSAEHASMYKRHKESLVASGAQVTAPTVLREFKTKT